VKGKMRVLIKTFGCKTNYADTLEIARSLHSFGVEITLDEELDKGNSDWRHFDAIIINSCVVTNEAEGKSRRYARRALRRFKNAQVILTGCGGRSKALAHKFAELGVKVVGELDEVVADIREFINECQSSTTADLAFPEGSRGRLDRSPAPALYTPGRARYFLKVQDGCNSVCSFCIVPQVRTISMKSLESIMAEVEFAEEVGYSEIVITGINVGLYREPAHGYGLDALIEKILGKLGDGSRLRLSSIEPEHVTEKLLASFANRKMCPHLHLPLQSGSDKVLKDMRRRYTSTDYLRIVDAFRKNYPHGAVTSDIMVGYPTESWDDFKKTLKVVQLCAFERVHIFPYSERPGTLSSLLRPHTGDEVRAREEELFEVAGEVARKSLGRFIGKRVEVAVEGVLRTDGNDEFIAFAESSTEAGLKNAKGKALVRANNNGQPIFSGYGEAYQRVNFACEADQVPRLATVQLEKLTGQEFFGRMIP